MRLQINLGDLLQAKKLSLYRFSKDTGMSFQQVSAIAKGQTRRIDFKTIELICEKLGCDMGELFSLSK
jgi:DNA-binding Xre family transcriptional regulator